MVLTFQLINQKKILKDMAPQGDIPSSSDIITETLKMAWPAVLESFLVSITGFVDTLMVSSLGTEAIAAVGLTTQPKFLGLCIFLALGVAISSIVARRRGEDDRESANRVLKTCIIATVIITIIIAFFFIRYADAIIDFAGAKEDTHQFAVDYFRIIMAGIVFQSLMITINAAQRGAGNTKISMRTNITANLVNIFFNYLLIGGNFGFPALGVKGAAIATDIGMVVGCIMCFASMMHKSSFIYIGAVKSWIMSRRDVRSVLDVGLSSFVEQLFMRIGFFLFALTVANLGTVEFAAHQIGMNFMSISFSFADGLSVASVALVGRSLGQKRQDLAKLYSTVCQRIGIICAAIISLLFLIFGKDLFSLFSEDQVILDYGVMIMRVLCIALFMQIEQVTILGCLRGAGDTKYTAFVSFVCVTIIRPGASWLLGYPLGLGLLGVWLGTIADQFVRFVMAWVRYKKGKWLNISI
jgi:putative MATE family efflux protein